WIAGKYEVVAHLRRGGMADVYQARGVGDGKLLALKRLPFQFLSDRTIVLRFRREALRARAFDHPNITRVLDHGEDLVDHYLVMELATGWQEGGQLALDVGDLPRPRPLAEALDIARQACEGLD